MRRRRLPEFASPSSGGAESQEAMRFAAQMAHALREILNSGELQSGEKNAIFTRFMQEIRPVGDGFRIALRPFRFGSHAVPVAFGESSIR